MRSHANGTNTSETVIAKLSVTAQSMSANQYQHQDSLSEGGKINDKRGRISGQNAPPKSDYA